MKNKFYNIFLVILTFSIFACSFNFQAWRQQNRFHMYQYEINRMGQAVIFHPGEGSIPVYYNHQLSDIQIFYIRKAVEYWNFSIGFDLFGEPTPGTSWNRNSIYISWGHLGLSESGNQIHGLCRRFYINNSLFMRRYIDYSSITMWDRLPKRYILVVLIHELGHSIGLGHDEDVRSVMYPHAAGSGGQIEAQDIDFIIRFYSNRFNTSDIQSTNYTENQCIVDYRENILVD